MNIVAAKMYKYLKVHLKKSPNLRIMQRPLLLARSMTITRALNLLFNIPGIYEELRNKPYELVLLQHLKPHLWCDLQTMLLAFSLLSNEVYQPIESIIVQSVVASQLGTFPSGRFLDLVHHRNIEKSKQEMNANQALLSAAEKAAQEGHPIRQDPLWAIFRDAEHLPLEALWRERAFNKLFRTISSRKSGKNYNKDTTPEVIEQAHQTGNNFQGNNEELIDLNYLKLEHSLTELVWVFETLYFISFVHSFS